MTSSGIARETVLEFLARVLASTPFRGADRSAALLRFVAERALDGDAARLKEYTVGVEALGRGTGFDPRTDPIVRAEASRLRGRLERYYAGEGRDDAVMIELPKGTYVPRFSARTPAAPVRSSSRRRPIVWTMAGVLVTTGAFAVGAWIVRPSSRVADRPVMRLDVQLQSAGTVGSEVGTDVVISGDASRVVFVSTDSAGVKRLRTRRFDGSEAADLPGTEGARGPFWSPDGHWIGYWAARQLRKIAVDGGSPVVICDATDLLGASWGDDGTIVATLNSTSTLWRVPASGGTPKAFLDLAAEHTAPRWPQLLPGGNNVLYTAITPFGADRASIEVASLAGGRPKVLIKGGTFGRYVSPGYLTFVNQGTLYAVRFDVNRLETRGTPVPIIDDVAYSATFGFAQLSISDGGVAVYRRSSAGGRLIVAMLDSAGRTTPVLETPGRYTWPALSPDGHRLAVSVVENGVSTVSVFTNSNDRQARPTLSIAGYSAGTWTPDGRYLIASGARGLGWVAARGGPVRELLSTANVSVPWSFSHDGQQLAFAAMSPATAFDLWTVPIEETNDGLRAGPATAFLRTPSFETYPALSPDGRWLAYTSNESGSWEIYVRATSDTGVKVQVSRGGGRVPRWSSRSRRLFFATDDQRIMVASYAASSGTFAAGSPRQWTPVRLGDTGVLANFDLGVDDEHIVALLPARGGTEAQAANHVTLVLSFAADIRRRVE